MALPTSASLFCCSSSNGKRGTKEEGEQGGSYPTQRRDQRHIMLHDVLCIWTKNTFAPTLVGRSEGKALDTRVERQPTKRKERTCLLTSPTTIRCSRPLAG